MTNGIEISWDSVDYRKMAPKKLVAEVANRTLAIIGLSGVQFSISFIGEDRMHEMNLSYRNIDDSTDILSFATCDDVEGFTFIQAGRRRRELGDMLICPEVMARNAKAFGITEDEELRRLVIHGVLHLSGMDHRTNDMKTEPMLIRQEEILKSLSASSAS